MRAWALALSCTLILVRFEAVASYPSARPNHDLREELAEDHERLIPSFEHFSFAVDGDSWLRGLSTQDFYHGVGYWLQLRSEARPSPYFAVNARTIAYSGSSSEGYGNPTGFYSLVGLTGVWPERIFGARLSARIVDLERQTLGEGLLVQNREMNGALVSLVHEAYTFKLRGDSTGALVYGDDFLNPELTLWEGWIGGGAGFWTQSERQSDLTRNRDPYYYLTSAQRWGAFGYGVEVGRRARAGAGLIQLSYVDRSPQLLLKGRLEYRNYQAGFGKDLTRQIEHQYVSYDQYDKPFTDAMNVFVHGDDAQVSALNLDVEYKLSHRWRVESLNEVGQFDFDGGKDRRYYFYRVGASICPLPDREDRVTLFVSNKVLSDSYARPPRERSLDNVEFFRRVDFAGLEGTFRF